MATRPPHVCQDCRISNTCGMSIVRYDGVSLNQCKVQCWAISECLSIEALVYEDSCSLYGCSATTTENGGGYNVIHIRDGMCPFHT